MVETTRLVLDFNDVAMLRDMAQHYLATVTMRSVGIEADDIDGRRELMSERATVADLYERADRAVKRLAAR